MKKVYLAIQYSGFEEESFKYANRLAGDFMRAGYVVFSPISHSHPIQKEMGIDTSWEFWKQQDFPMIEWCDILYVSGFGDWRKSTGVKAEVEFAKKIGKQIVFGGYGRQEI